MEKLGEQVPATTKFNIGYFKGKQSKRHWIYCQEDIDAMYPFFKPGSEVSLWCNAKNEDDDSSKSRKRRHEQTKRDEKE